MADIRGLLSDPQFNALDAATQKQVLGRVDPAFASLSDADFQQFKTKVSRPTPPTKPTDLAARGVPLPYGLSKNDNGTTKAEQGMEERYRKTYGQEPGPGLLHNKQGSEEILGAMMLPAARGALLAP